MRAAVSARVPEEACGLLAGRIEAEVYSALAVFPITNVLHSPVRYRMDPTEQLAAFDEIDARGWELVAIYHSHPTGPEGPSATDIGEAYYPEVVYLIWSLNGNEWQCRGYTIQSGEVRPAAVWVTD